MRNKDRILHSNPETSAGLSSKSFATVYLPAKGPSKCSGFRSERDGESGYRLPILAMMMSRSSGPLGQPGQAALDHAY